jgi:hypothetical protein
MCLVALVSLYDCRGFVAASRSQRFSWILVCGRHGSLVALCYPRLLISKRFSVTLYSILWICDVLGFRVGTGPDPEGIWAWIWLGFPYVCFMCLCAAFYRLGRLVVFLCSMLCSLTPIFMFESLCPRFVFACPGFPMEYQETVLLKGTVAWDFLVSFFHLSTSHKTLMKSKNTFIYFWALAEIFLYEIWLSWDNLRTAKKFALVKHIYLITFLTILGWYRSPMVKFLPEIGFRSNVRPLKSKIMTFRSTLKLSAG